jgi:hypothetical protein
LPRRALFPIGAGLIVSALLLTPAPCRASAVTHVSINGETDDDTQFVTATASASTPGPAAFGTAEAYGDLASGTLRARTEGDAVDAIGGGLHALASSELTDVLFLTPEVGSSTNPVSFTLFMDLDGFLFVGGGGLASPNLQLASARARAMLEISGPAVSNISPASLTVTRRVQASGGTVLDDSTTVDLQQNTSGTVLDGSLDIRLTATAMVTPSSAINVRAFLAAESDAEAAFSSLSDLSQTGRLGVVVPDGYSLTSSSGVFLTVPEPRASTPFALAVVALLAAVRGWRVGIEGRRRASRSSLSGAATMRRRPRFRRSGRGW